MSVGRGGAHYDYGRRGKGAIKIVVYIFVWIPVLFLPVRKSVRLTILCSLASLPVDTMNDGSVYVYICVCV